MSDFRRIEDVEDLALKTALVRVDFNVPVNDAGEVTDDTRLRAALPTVQYLMNKGAKVALLAHFGRPKGEVKPELSLKPVAEAFGAVLSAPVAFASDCVGEAATNALASIQQGGVVLLENTRFKPGETKNDDALADEMAKLGDIYVNDAFSAAHRAHVSTEGLAQRLPAYAGKSMERELDALEAALGSPERPVLAVVGGAKVSSKIDLLKNLVSKVDALAIGGGMANTFLAARGHSVGKSLCEHDLTDTCREIEKNAAAAGCDIILPQDVVVAKEFAANADHRICSTAEVADNEMILDAGPQSVGILAIAMDAAKTLVWNGPLGAFETTPFDKATVEAARAAASRCRDGDLIAVAGGGDTVAALNHAGVADDFTFVSTAGGAFLEWMEGKPLPGVEALKTS
ncbi:MAG TPA: phosphoglycerate kinase [Henriciella marina]|uniref:phosphoglycerate kinase n=1 Tax=Henriciella sp. TaxID=1968823 RepID=UPI00183B771C|nr:phosphoglycerate kinase [Henriciella sp.]HIG21344.1 phosphoglycerate kinase [Henriciella sp.]HIK64914.1 phosphoglycerate kinase [Henriciella marina]